MAYSVPMTQCYIWEWQRDDGGWSPYPGDVIQLLEDQFNKTRSPSFDLQHLPNSAKSRHLRLQENIVDFTAMEQVHKESGYRCHVRRSLIQLPPISPCVGEWSWELAHGMFVLYDVVSMLVIEEAYQAHHVQGRQEVNLLQTPANLPYTISFQAVAGYMCQIRHGFNTRRRVKRFPLDNALQVYLCGTAQGQPPQVSSLAGALGPVQPHPSTAHYYVPQATPPITSVGGAYRGSSASNFTGSVANLPGSILPSTLGAGPTSVFAAPSYLHPTSSTGSGWGGEGSSTASGRGGEGSSTASGRGGEGSSTASGWGGEGSPYTPSKREGNGLASAPQRSFRIGPRVPPLDPSTASYVSTVRKLAADEDEPCPVCLCKLSEPSDYQTVDLGLDLVQMLKCSHRLHRLCFQQYLQSQTSSPSGIRCPTCKKIHGVKVGDMPKEYGAMHVRRTHLSLPGYESYGCIEITYSFRPGTDRNGQHFSTHGFPRVCYLPNCPKGQRVLRLLQVAWERRLTFTIGTSVTTGARNTVVWNEIHHKTECHGNMSGHGYPDPNYLDNVLMELEAQGVTEEEEE